MGLAGNGFESDRTSGDILLKGTYRSLTVVGPGAFWPSQSHPRGDPTDEQWAVLELLLPKGKKAGRPPLWTRRQLIDGIRFRHPVMGHARRVRAVGPA